MPVLIEIDLGSELPAYRQIANALRTQLVAAQLAAGDQLPTVRELALDLGVHHNTVAQAYRLLSDEGWLDLRRRRGVTVLERQSPRAPPQAAADFRQRLAELVAQARTSGLEVAELVGQLRQLATVLSKEKQS